MRLVCTIFDFVSRFAKKNKAKSIEELTLDQLINNLNLDIIDLQNNIRADSITIISYNIISDNLTHSQTYHDSLSMHFGRLGDYTNFINNTSAYESLKSVGLNRITNDFLRFEIINYYEKYSKYLINIEKEFINNAENMFIKPFLIKHFLYTSSGRPAFPNNYESLIKNNQIKSIIYSTRSGFLWKIELTKECKKIAIDLKKKVMQELENSN